MDELVSEIKGTVYLLGADIKNEWTNPFTGDGFTAIFEDGSKYEITIKPVEE